MKIEHKEAAFVDERGVITDVFVGAPKEHSTVISTKKGAVRGNHYHKVSRQWDFIVSGSFRVFGKREGGQIEEATVSASDLISWESGEAHEFIALEDSVFITFVDGVRGGANFESDTYRLETPLHEEIRTQ